VVVCIEVDEFRSFDVNTMLFVVNGERPVPEATNHHTMSILVVRMVAQRFHSLGVAGPADVVAVHASLDLYMIQVLVFVAVFAIVCCVLFCA
jgi:hypothetical protein